MASPTTRRLLLVLIVVLAIAVVSTFVAAVFGMRL